MENFEILDCMNDDWLMSKRLLEKGDKESLKKLRELEDEKLVLVNSIKKS